MNLSPLAASRLADAVLYIHFGIVCFILLGFILISAGRAFRWRWTKNRPFRHIHLGLILLVALQALLGRLCSFTILEHNLRIAAGEAGYKRGLIADFISGLLYYDLPDWVFTLVYTAAAITALFLFIIWPPEWGKGK